MDVRNDLAAWSKIPGWKPTGPTAAAHATNMPTEVFTRTDRGGIEAQTLQGKVAKALGAQPTEVQITRSTVTFTGKALEQVQASMKELALNTAAGLSSCPAGALSCKQLALHAYDGGPEGNQGVMEYPAHIVTDPNPKASAITKLSYLMSPGPGQ